jgi:hypothetical protein
VGDISILNQILSQQTPQAAPESEQGERASLTVVPMPGSPMSKAEQAQAAMSHIWAMVRRQLRDLREREGNWIHHAWHGRPGSLAELDEYARSRAWVPVALRTPEPSEDGEDEQHKASFVELEGALYYATIGRAGKAIGNWISWTAERQLRFLLTLLIFTVLAVIAAIWLA